MQKRLLTIQDISCFGKCSLTVALPIISAMGIECCVVPTSILSTHTAYPNPVIVDLTENIKATKDHWSTLDISFDAITSGYLSSYSQLEYVDDFFTSFKNKDTLIFVDPVMGDHGRLYKGFDENFIYGMSKLCSKADIIMPNITETCFMLNKDYSSFRFSSEHIKDCLKELCDLGCKKAVITGVSYNNNKQGAVMYDSAKNEFHSYFLDTQPHSYYGTGDIFSSVLSSSMTKGLSDYDALKLSVEFTVECIKTTALSNDKFSNIKFETNLPMLYKAGLYKNLS